MPVVPSPDPCAQPGPGGISSRIMAGARRDMFRGTVVVVLLGLLFLAILLIQPGGHSLMVALDDFGTVTCELVGLLFCAFGLRSATGRLEDKAGGTARRAWPWARILITAALAAAAIGDSIFAIYEHVLGRVIPSPSVADIFYLLQYPLLLAAILLLARRSLPLITKTRILVDGCMIIVTAVTFSWYFVLGPTLLDGSGSMLGRLVNTAYPFSDLLLVCCLLLLGVAGGHPVLRYVVALLSLALGFIVVTDSAYDYFSLQGTYATGNLLDAGWVIGYLLIGLTVFVARWVPEDWLPAAEEVAAAQPSSLWRSLIVYAILPAVVILQIAVGYRSGPTALDVGVDIGAFVVIALVVMRQILALREVTDHSLALVRLNAELQAARLEAEAAVRVRDELLAAASHDLRTPLTMVRGVLERIAIRKERGQAIEEEWLNAQFVKMEHASSRMLSTVEEITDAAQLRSGHELALFSTDVDLGQIVEAITAMVADANKWSGVSPIEVIAPPGLKMHADRSRIERVVQNIVGNAVKYSPEGTPVRVELRRDAQWAVITVQDRGVGIPAEQLPSLFTHFFRASTSIGIPGSGIGLAGSQQIVEQHGGRITVTSALGEGTTVRVFLPLLPSSTSALAVAAAEEPRTGSVALPAAQVGFAQ